MPIRVDNFNDDIIHLLKNGGIGVLRTDTIYGVVAKADDERAVERLYKVKTRTPSKSPIVLIASTDQLFDAYDQATLERIHALWPGKVSIILPSGDAPWWIKRENASVAYRIPANEELRALLRQTGPLVAPSANPEGSPTADTIDEAEKYFGDQVDFYIDGGKVTDNTPSKLYRLQNDDMERLR